MDPGAIYLDEHRCMFLSGLSIEESS